MSLASISMTKIAIGVSVIWVLAVFAYGLGYVARLDATEAGRTLPTLDFMFLVFAVAGPLAMIWIVVTLLRRAEILSDTISAQGESALALAATIVNLNDSIDAMSEGTQGRLIQACDRMEQHADQAAATFERNLSETGSRLNRVLLESVVLIDERIAGRVDAFEAALERQRASLDQHLRDDTTRLSDSLEAQAFALQRRLGDDTERLSNAIKVELSSLSELKSSLIENIREGLSESRAKLDQGISQVLTHQKSGVQQTNEQLHKALDAFSATLIDVQNRQSRLIDSDIGEPVRELTAVVEETRKAFAASPPASPEALADLLGRSTHHILRKDRKTVEDIVLRVAKVEEKAGRMLDLIDRTSRLNPLMEWPHVTPPSTPDADASAEAASLPELPFPELPRSIPRAPVNWAAALRTLDGDADRPGAGAAVRTAAQDPDIALLLNQVSSLAAVLADDKVHLEDLTPEHASAPLWHRYAMGERGAEVAQLGDIGDEITLALVRARLRSDTDFRALVIRFADGYGGLLRRAANDLGPDPKLVELAETRAGRAFILLGGLVGAFDPVGDPLDRAG